MPTERQVTFAEFAEHLASVSVPRRVAEVIVHHTWRPTAAQYRGLSTVAGVRRYHMEERGWSDNGYHIMIGPPGDIFLCRPLAQAGAHCLGHNAYSIGVSFIADFDCEDPDQYPGLLVGQQIIAALLHRFDLQPADIHFHREFADKSCPGRRLQLEPFRQAVQQLTVDSRQSGDDSRQLLSTVPCPLPTDTVKIVLLPGSQVIPCRAKVEHEVTRVDVRPLAQVLGYEVYDHIPDQGKVYVRRKVINADQM